MHACGSSDEIRENCMAGSRSRILVICREEQGSTGTGLNQDSMFDVNNMQVKGHLYRFVEQPILASRSQRPRIALLKPSANVSIWQPIIIGVQQDLCMTVRLARSCHIKLSLPICWTSPEAQQSDAMIWAMVIYPCRSFHATDLPNKAALIYCRPSLACNCRS